jgi:hypothetical protein
MPHSPPAPPPIIPDHELLRCVGRGSYGEVWLARNILGTFRAVKIVHRSRFDSDRPFEREFAGIQKFEPVSRTHPGLVAVLHVGRAEGTTPESRCFYYMMEVADDAVTGKVIDPATYKPRTLAGELQRRVRLPLEECVELGRPLTSGWVLDLGKSQLKIATHQQRWAFPCDRRRLRAKSPASRQDLLAQRRRLREFIAIKLQLVMADGGGRPQALIFAFPTRLDADGTPRGDEYAGLRGYRAFLPDSLAEAGLPASRFTC